MATTPDAALQHELLARHARAAFLDEVGRGALAGPVCVGAVLLDRGCGPAPDGLADSKLLSAAQREALVSAITGWVRAWAVGEATSAEIDRYGILRALRLAAERALVTLGPLDAVLLDGSYDWVRRPARLPESPVLNPLAELVCEVRADQSSEAVAAASILAKCHRDALMTRLDTEWPGYGLATHKGYGTPAHRAAIGSLGTAPIHRRSWALTASGTDQLAFEL